MTAPLKQGCSKEAAAHIIQIGFLPVD